MLLPLASVGCLPTSGTLPTRTFRPGERSATCSPASLADPTGPLWSAESRRILEAKHAKDEPIVASVLGCHVEVLEGCRAQPGDLLAKDLDGPCTGATHVVLPVSKQHVELQALSLGDYRLTGTFRGVMRQPAGPFTAYNTTLYLAQDGARITGVTRLETLDHEYWGDLRLEGRLVGNVVFFRDAAVLDEHVPLLGAWCAKGGYLIVDPRRGLVVGPWTAPFCAPGTLELQRVEDHPRVLLPHDEM
ncbi:MAG TPA: hypothetical protein VLT33_50970 [Labilithrix sp.]|nr:hypothetical protein [Labilithrix sp.]